MREHVKAAEEFVREDVPVAQARERFVAERQDYKVELIDDLVAAADSASPPADRLAVHERALHRPLPRPARAQHEDRRRVQAAVGRGRLLARRLRPHDAHPHLRHRLLHQGRARGAPRAARAGPRARPPQARPGARPVHVLRALARQPVLEARGHGDLERAHRAVAQGEPQPRLPRGENADPLRRRAVAASRATGTSTRTTCTSPTSRGARWG